MMDRDDTLCRLGCKRQSYFLFCFCLLAILPISVISEAQGGLPVDIVPSDILMTAITLTWIFSSVRYPSRVLPTLLIFVLYGFVLANLSALSKGSVIPLLSFAKFNKVIFAFLAGYALSRWYGRDNVLRAFSAAACAYLLILPVSEFFYHGNFVPRLGSELFDIPIYGFSNSSSSYIVFLLCISLIKKRGNTISLSLMVLTGLFALGSASRIALLLAVLAIGAFLVGRRKNIIPRSLIIFAVLAVAVVSNLGDSLNLETIANPMIRRFEVALRNGDFSNGRAELFKSTIDLISNRPFFGYGYQSFSYFGTHGTPHNQYLELAFKTGIVGLLLYFTVILTGIRHIISLKQTLSKDLSARGVLVMLGLVMLGNLTQPNLSYSPTGNLVFLLFGLFAVMPRGVLETSIGRHYGASQAQ